MENFSSFIKEERLSKDLSLRNFCLATDEDFSNWSKVERNLINPPTDKKRLLKIAQILDINETSDKFKKMYDLACIQVKQLPDYITDDQEILKLLPVFFRTVENVKPTREELEKLIEDLRHR